MSLLDREIDPRFERSRYANALTYIDETDDGVRRYIVEFDVVNDPGGAGVVTTYDLKRPGSKGHLVSVDGVRLEGWTILEETGPANSDQIDLDAASLPANGATVRVVYDQVWAPSGEFYGRRTEIEIDEDSDPQVFETTGDETLWHIAGRPDTYDDPAWFWPIVDANPGLNGVFKAMLKPIKRGVELDIPTEAEVLLQIDGLFEL